MSEKHKQWSDADLKPRPLTDFTHVGLDIYTVHRIPNKTKNWSDSFYANVVEYIMILGW